MQVAPFLKDRTWWISKDIRYSYNLKSIIEPLFFPRESKMTYLEAVYRYQRPPGEAELRAIDTVREVYGIQRVQFNEKERTVHVLFDASRLKSDSIVKLLRQAGIDVLDQIILA